MRERPMIFCGYSVRSILADLKWATRRVVKGIDPDRLGETMTRAQWQQVNREMPEAFGATDFCPYGQPGDRLWVREAWAADAQLDSIPPRDLSQGEPILYQADGALRQTGCSMVAKGKQRPAMFMPRWASRILLEITSVRVERLHAITNDQCIAEGCRGGHGSIPGYIYNATPQEHFRHIWESVGGDYFANPWVWVVEFRRVTA
ncbi:hypothetical protein [Pseudomonas tohonis]|uniref:hypothetical protein n=1 Tax=Pseudomonas tohonis TaxID=2725477 RepID=UPI001F41A0F9|nr:hypothetical protein [Pseudomonas tohonis]